MKTSIKCKTNWFFSSFDQFWTGFGPVFWKTGCNHFGPVFKWSRNHPQASQSSPVRFSSKKGKKTGLDQTFKLYMQVSGDAQSLTRSPTKVLKGQLGVYLEAWKMEGIPHQFQFFMLTAYSWTLWSVSTSLSKSWEGKTFHHHCHWMIHWECQSVDCHLSCRDW